MKIDSKNLQEQCPGPEGLRAYVDGKLTSEKKVSPSPVSPNVNNVAG
jgi:hypothetical protein